MALYLEVEGLDKISRVAEEIISEDMMAPEK